VVVTGASGGLGSATVTAYLNAGHEVIGLDRRAAPNRPSFTPVVVDLTDEQAMRRVMRDIGPVNHVVSVAGGALPGEKANVDLADLELAVFRTSLEQNLVSAFVTLQAALPNLRAAEGDRSVAFTTSTDAMISYGLPGYAAAKGGIIALINALTSPLGAEGIRINGVAPGDIPTARNKAEWAHRPDWYTRLAAANPLGRLCTPTEIAETFLALSDRMTGITGQTIVVDAGLVRGQVVASGFDPEPARTTVHHGAEGYDSGMQEVGHGDQRIHGG
jgi:NAD(P)-dependent dehydrogenase (short-subunit alcohol dehydrogenase family)